MSNDLPRILVEKDLITFTNNNNNKTNYNKELLLNNYNTNYNNYYERENLINKEKEIIDRKNKVYINTEVKKKSTYICKIIQRY